MKVGDLQEANTNKNNEVKPSNNLHDLIALFLFAFKIFENSAWINEILFLEIDSFESLHSIGKF